jgi:hypothetical protein
MISSLDDAPESWFRRSCGYFDAEIFEAGKRTLQIVAETALGFDNNQPSRRQQI